MSTSQLRDRIAALRAESAAIGAELTEHAPRMESGELFEIAGDLQGAVNAAEGAQLVAIAHASCLEIRLTERGPVDVHHDVGYVDAMASCEVSLATGVGQWAAARKVGLAANLSSRFPRLLGKVIAGDLAPVNAGKVLTACDGLDDAACTAVEAVLADRLVGMDPARITTVARRVATRIAADQVARRPPPRTARTASCRSPPAPTAAPTGGPACPPPAPPPPGPPYATSATTTPAKTPTSPSTKPAPTPSWTSS